MIGGECYEIIRKFELNHRRGVEMEKLIKFFLILSTINTKILDIDI